MATEEREKIGFGKRLKAAREAVGMSGTKLGLGLQPDGDASRQTISDWEAERHYPSVWQLRLICQKLHVSSDYLLFGRTEAPDPVSARYRTAQLAVNKLSDEERLQLLAAVAQPGLVDEEVEERIPATRRKAPKPE